VNQEGSEQNEVDGMKKGADSTGKIAVVSYAIKLHAMILSAVGRRTLKIIAWNNFRMWFHVQFFIQFFLDFGRS